MVRARKRYLRKKSSFLRERLDYALFESSNLNASKLRDVQRDIGDTKLYHAPSYTLPPKLGSGSSLSKLVPGTKEEMKAYLGKVSSKMFCLGLYVETRWYAGHVLEKSKTKNPKEKILSLLLKQKEDSCPEGHEPGRGLKTSSRAPHVSETPILASDGSNTA